jgi:hypothetical protein
LFLTPNTEDSRWIPWELGLAHSGKDAERIAMFPASDESDRDWVEREYLGLATESFLHEGDIGPVLQGLPPEAG